MSHHGIWKHRIIPDGKLFVQRDLFCMWWRHLLASLLYVPPTTIHTSRGCGHKCRFYTIEGGWWYIYAWIYLAVCKKTNGPLALLISIFVKVSVTRVSSSYFDIGCFLHLRRKYYMDTAAWVLCRCLVAAP